MCGSMRRPPASTTQRRPEETPQIGHGTDDNCFLVRSPVLTVSLSTRTSHRNRIPFPPDAFFPAVADKLDNLFDTCFPRFELGLV